MDESGERPPEEPTEDRYDVFCPNCGEVFDACRSPWCSCITDVPTLMCPHCDRCFCAASSEERQAFWRDAPAALWQRRLKKGSRAEPPPQADEDSQGHRPLVLVVEDEPDTLRVAFKAVEALGYGVLLAKNGLEALALARKRRPDLILSDVMMPQMDGKHLCAKIKADPSLSRTPVLLMSGIYRRDSHRIEAMRRFGADDYLAKPITLARLGEVLEAWLAEIPGEGGRE